LVAIAPAGAINSLDPARLDPSALAARDQLRRTGAVELRALLTATAPVRPKAISTPFISVLHIDDLGIVDWAAAADYAPTTTGVLAPPGSLIVSLLNPAKLRAAVVPEEAGPVQVSAEFGVFASAIDPYAVLGLLHSPLVRAQLRPLGTGTSSSRRRIGLDDVLSLTVPAPADDALAELGRAVRAAVQRITDGRAELLRHFTTA
jgi:hypothetical protein